MFFIMYNIISNDYFRHVDHVDMNYRVSSGDSYRMPSCYHVRLKLDLHVSLPFNNFGLEKGNRSEPLQT